MPHDFDSAVRGLLNGDFSASLPLMEGGEESQIAQWFDAGRFADHQDALAEALTCACFLGETATAEHLIKGGVDLSAGNLTGLDALHWAGNRGELAAVELLLRYNVDLETTSMYGANALGTVVWSLLNETRGNQLAVIERLLDAGADLGAAHIAELGFPTGHEELDRLIAGRVTNE